MQRFLCWQFCVLLLKWKVFNSFLLSFTEFDRVLPNVFFATIKMRNRGRLEIIRTQSTALGSPFPSCYRVLPSFSIANRKESARKKRRKKTTTKATTRNGKSEKGSLRVAVVFEAAPLAQQRRPMAAPTTTTTTDNSQRRRGDRDEPNRTDSKHGKQKKTAATTRTE